MPFCFPISYKESLSLDHSPQVLKRRVERQFAFWEPRFGILLLGWEVQLFYAFQMVDFLVHSPQTWPWNLFPWGWIWSLSVWIWTPFSSPLAQYFVNLTLVYFSELNIYIILFQWKGKQKCYYLIVCKPSVPLTTNVATLPFLFPSVGIVSLL